MNERPRVWIQGTGAVGSALAALLASAGRATPVLIGSRAHWQAIRAGGLRVSIAGGLRLTLVLETHPSAAAPAWGPADLLLLAGKLPRLAADLSRLRDRVPPSLGVIALHNGLDVARQVAELLGRPVERGLVLFGAHCPEPGLLDLHPGGLRLQASPAGRRAGELFAGDLVACELVGEMRTAEWSKLALNCVANPLAALLDVRNARLAQADLDPVKAEILDEVRAVARAEGVALDLDLDQFNRYMQGPTGDNIASMRADILRGEPTEIDQLNGVVVALGERRGLPMPANRMMVGLIHALSTDRRRGAAPC